MARSRFQDTDRGAKALLQRVSKARTQGGLELRVGLIGDAAAEKAVDGNGLTVAQVGNAHEFGLGPPMRSFIRAPVDANAAQIRRDLATAARAVKDGRVTQEQGLNLLGFRIVGLIQQTMADGIAPALSPGYLPRKLRKYPGATTPLIASGQLRSAVTHKVSPREGA